MGDAATQAEQPEAKICSSAAAGHQTHTRSAVARSVEAKLHNVVGDRIAEIFLHALGKISPKSFIVEFEVPAAVKDRVRRRGAVYAVLRFYRAPEAIGFLPKSPFYEIPIVTPEVHSRQFVASGIMDTIFRIDPISKEKDVKVIVCA